MAMNFVSVSGLRNRTFADSGGRGRLLGIRLPSSWFYERNFQINAKFEQQRRRETECGWRCCRCAQHFREPHRRPRGGVGAYSQHELLRRLFHPENFSTNHKRIEGQVFFYLTGICLCFSKNRVIKLQLLLIYQSMTASYFRNVVFTVSILNVLYVFGPTFQWGHDESSELISACCKCDTDRSCAAFRRKILLLWKMNLICLLEMGYLTIFFYWDSHQKELKKRQRKFRSRT